VIATDANGCEVEAVILNVIATNEELNNKNTFYIFPNPVTSELKIDLPAGRLGNEELRMKAAVTITIYDLMGRPFFSHFDQLPSTIDCKQFPDGVYFLEIASEEKIFRTRFVKQ
jgi:hypothetical protein